MSEVESARAVIEVLFPEYGNQGGDNGNALLLRQSLPGATFIETRYGDEPYFVRNEPSLIVMSSMPEMQQENALKALLPHRDRLAALVDAGVPMLVTGSACDLLCRRIVSPGGTAIEALGIVDAVCRRSEPRRYLDVNLGTFDPADGTPPIELVGFKIQFTQIEGDNSASYFSRNEVGFGLREGMQLEGFRKRNLLATWMLGPILPLNPDFTAWLMRLVTGRDIRPAHEALSRASHAARVKEFRIKGAGIHV